MSRDPRVKICGSRTTPAYNNSANCSVGNVIIEFMHMGTFATIINFT